MRGSLREWILLAAVFAVVEVISIAVGNRDAGEDKEPRPNPSSYNAQGSGSLGVYLWLQALGIRVQRWEQPFQQLCRCQDAAVLLVIGPRVVPVEEGELKSLEEWVEQGGVLVLADSTVGAPVPGIRAGAPVLQFGLRPTVGASPSGSFSPAFPSRYIDGVGTIEPQGRVRFQRQRPEGWAPLFADVAGDWLAIRHLGRGTIIAASDPGLFSNARLEVADHARLMLNIVEAHRGKGMVLVDEFHHGHGYQGAFSRYLRGTAIPWVLIQTALTFLAFLVARGTRFGAPVPPPGGARASSLEYVSALGDLYQRAGARALAVETLAGSLRRTLAVSLGMNRGEEAPRLAASAAGRLEIKEGLVRACLVPGKAATGSDEGLLRFARAVHRMEARLRPRPGSAPFGRRDDVGVRQPGRRQDQG